jgi:ABC-2 type transport system permease protein
MQIIKFDMPKFGTIISLFLREAQRIPKDHSLMLTLLIAPLLYAFFYGSIYLNKFEEEVATAVIDYDNSALTRELIFQLNATPQINIIAVQHQEEYVDRLFNNGDVQVVIQFAKETEKDIKLLKGTTVLIKSNASRFLPANDVVQAAATIFTITGVGVRMEYYKATGHYQDVALQMANPAEIVYKPLFNHNLAYGDFLIPGLLILILQQTLLIGLAEGTARERQKGTLPEWLKLGQGSVGALLGKSSFYLILFGSFAMFFNLVNMQLLEISNNASPTVLIALFTIFLASIIPMGIWIGLLFKKELLAMQVMAFSTYPLFLISGYSWPQSALPSWLQIASNLIPTTPMLDAYVKATEQGASLGTLLPQCTHMMILGLVFWVLAHFQLEKCRKSLE